MAALLGSGTGNYTSVTGDGEPLLQPTAAEQRKHGGWTTAPFIIGGLAGLSLAGGWMANLIVFLIQQFNIKRIDAAQIHNIVLGGSSFFPVTGAILADSCLGCFSVIWISSLISLLGLILLMASVTIDRLRPPVCETAGSVFNCVSPSGTQYAVLFAALGLASIGLGGSKFTLATMGANQFTNLNHKSTYFNWYFSVMYFSSFIAATGLVYVEDNVSWGWGLGICMAANVVGLAMFLTGKRYYRPEKKLKGSPFTSLLRVIVASVRKRNVKMPSEGADYYYGDDDDDGVKGRIPDHPPTNSFRLLNRAALKTDGDIQIQQPNGTIAKHESWKVCTVQQVEDLKTLIRILPLWSTSILLGTPIGVQLSLTVLQALTTDRHLSPRFQFPAASMIVFSYISTALWTSLLDRCLSPLWQKLSGRKPTPLQQIGIGHVFTIASMAVSALVESKRRAHPSTAPMSVLWLVPQMVIIGIGEAFHFPGQVALYYEEFPTCLKSVSTAMVGVLIGLAYYSSLGAIEIVRRATEWLPDDINDGRVDNVYWVMVVIGVFNFGYYLVCSCFYKYKPVRLLEEGESALDE